MNTATEPLQHLRQFDTDVTTEEFIVGGHGACAGCGGSIALKWLLKVMGPKTVMIIPPQCSGRASTNATITRVQALFPAAAAYAAGVKHGLEAIGDHETQVISYAGDGGTYDIGLQAISGAAERNDDIIHFCGDNEAYMNTGVQRSSSTPVGAWTNSSPSKSEPKKDMMAIMAAHHIPYAATVSIAYPDDYMRKVQQAKETKGFRFMRVLASCPTGWRSEPDTGVHIARLAVQAKFDPLYEMIDGERIVVQQPAKFVPVRDYLKTQRRFGAIKDAEIDAIQARVDADWEKLLGRASEVQTLKY
jgi:pyruvate/2-oxoacid:ferredoxin oxidoreductase beta subunit